MIEIQSSDPRPIAEHKVKQAVFLADNPVFVIDSGLFVDALGGFPGAMTEIIVNMAIGTKGILRLLKGMDRRARMVECLAFMASPADEPAVFFSVIAGKIANRRLGKKRKRKYWSDLAYIFIPEGEMKTLAQMDDAEYAAWCVKRDAISCVNKFAQWFLG